MEYTNNVDGIRIMEEIEIDFGPICRFCLAETNSDISIFDACLNDKSVCPQQDTIINFVLKFSRIKESTFQNFPTVVCKDCYNIVSGCYKFSLVCQQSDKSLQECYMKTLNETKCTLGQGKYDVTSNIDGNDLSKKEDVSKQEVVLIQLSDRNKRNEKTLTNVKNSSLVFKIDKIKQKYQKLNSLTQRLKDAQNKLKEDILRSNDIMLNIAKRDNLVSKVKLEKQSYGCPKCFKSFKNLKLLKFHLSTKHEDFKNRKNNNKFECTKCTHSFSNQETLLNHCKDIHNDLSITITSAIEEGQKKFYCFQCTPFKKYLTKDDLVNHLNTNHKGKNTDFPEPDTTNSPSIVSSPAMNFIEDLKTVDNIKTEEKIKKDNEFLINKNDNTNINLFKMFVCASCSPTKSFTNADECLKHKLTCHNTVFQNVSPKKLPSNHVESSNILKDDKAQSTPNVFFKVFCKNCDPPSEFTSTKAFVDHINTHGKSDVENWDIETGKLSNDTRTDCEDKKKWKCTDCPSTYYRRHSLCYHMKEKHNKLFNVTSVECPECGESFVTSRRLVQHGISAHGKYFAHFHKVFKRKILRAESEGGEGVEEDENKMKNFECDICQRKYSCKNSLKRHVLKTHLGKSKTETVVCSYCGKTLSSKLNLKSHIEFVHEALFVSCPLCKKKINFRTIGKHYKTHQPTTGTEFADSENQFLCNLCGKVLKSKKSFEDHQKLHKNIRDQLCDVCGSGFTTKKFLHLHKKTHEGVKRKVFGCSQCEKVFSGRHTLNRHLLTHSGEKNFICEICSKCFYTIQELNRHVRYHKKEYRFDCQLCEMRFLDKSRFRHHMMRHRNIRPHKCQFCDKMFIVKRKMNLHMAAKHNVQVKSTKVAWKDPKTYIPLDDLL